MPPAYALTFHPKPDGPSGEYRQKKLAAIVERFVVKLTKRSPVQRIEVMFDQPKNPVGKTVASGVTIHLFLSSGSSYIAKARNFVSKTRHVGVETGVREALKELLEQVRRHHRQYPGTAGRGPHPDR